MDRSGSCFCCIPPHPPSPQDTAEKAALMRELSFCHWERINGLFPPHLLVLFLTVCVLPRSPRNIPLLCQPLTPPTPLSAAYPAHFCMRCRGKCFPAVQAARHIYHDASLGSLRSAAQHYHQAPATFVVLLQNTSAGQRKIRDRVVSII